MIFQFGINEQTYLKPGMPGPPQTLWSFISIVGWYSIKVLKFEKPLIFNENVKPIPMPEARGDEWMTPGSKVRVCGWGNTSSIGTLYPSKLHCVDTFVSSKAQVICSI